MNGLQNKKIKTIVTYPRNHQLLIKLLRKIGIPHFRSEKSTLIPNMLGVAPDTQINSRLAYTKQLITKTSTSPLYQHENTRLTLWDKKIEAAIVQLWEFRPNVLLLFTVTNKNEINAKNPQINVVNNTFIWDLGLQTIRQSKFLLPEKYQDLQIDIFGTPELSMFRTFHFQGNKKQKATPSPAFYVQNVTQIIVKQQSWICSSLQKYTVLESNRNTIVEGIFVDRDISELKIRIINLPLSRKELSMFLLKNMKDQPKEELEYDLLDDIFKLLKYQEVFTY